MKTGKALSCCIIIISALFLVANQIVPLWRSDSVFAHSTVFAVSLIGIGIGFLLLGIFQLLEIRKKQ